MQPWQQEQQWYAEQSLATRQTWYAPVAATYDRVRPRYPDPVIAGAIAAAQLTPGETLLELGCGPGIVTLPLADRGFQLTALEPNPAFYALMQHKCVQYPQIRLINTTFEQWQPENARFAAVIAANALHWLDPAIAYRKAAQILAPAGHLIIFWHLKPEPSPAVFDRLRSAYDDVPQLFMYEGPAKQREIAIGLGQDLLASGYFQDLEMAMHPWSAVYNTADYLALLGTFSPYLRLTHEERDRVFRRLQRLIDEVFAGQIEVFSLCVFQVAKPRP